MKNIVVLGFDFVLEDECLDAKMAYKDLRLYIARGDGHRTWYSLKNLLRAVANISKVFWPAKRYADRGAEMRRRFSIPDDSPLRSRKMRDHAEHFDERIEDWLMAHPAFHRNGINYGRKTMLPLDSPPLFFFDCPTMSVVFLGDVLEIEPVMRAVEELLVRVTQDIGPLMAASASDLRVEAAKQHI